MCGVDTPVLVMYTSQPVAVCYEINSNSKSFQNNSNINVVGNIVLFSSHLVHIISVTAFVMDRFVVGDTIRERFEDIVKCGMYSDLVLKLKYKQNENEHEYVIKCHKLLLMSASTFFKERILGGLDNTIIIEEPNIKLFYIIIEFIYTQHVDLLSLETDDIISLFKLSDKYKIPKLMEFCCKVINKNSCCIIHLVKYFNLAIDLKIQSLRESCLQIIKQHTCSLFRHESFMSLNPEAVEVIIRQDDLNISEMELFLTVLKWAENKYADFYGDSANKQCHQIIPRINVANLPFYLQYIENKLLTILKIEPLNSHVAERSQLCAIYKLYHEFCNNGGFGNRVQSAMDKKNADYWKKMRHILDEYKITKYIRFLALDPLEFSCKISCRNILTNSELSDVLIILNSTNGSLMAPPQISNIRKPRKSYTNDAVYSKNKLRVYARLLFEFLHSHIFNNEHDLKFTEEFRVVSVQPILLIAVILPPKHRKGSCGNRYLEDLQIEVFKKSQIDEKSSKIAGANYFSKRKYDENVAVMLEYHIGDNSDAFLHQGTEFIVEVTRMSRGAYSGGLTQTSLNYESQFIVTKDKIQKGVIAGFGFYFDVGA